MEVHPLVCYDEQGSLGTALSSRDIDSFRVHSPTEVEKTEAETSMTIFERACQTPGCAQFIAKCLLAGCDANKLNPKLNKRPINFAAESHSGENLIALLEDPSVDVNSPCPMLNTPINTLAEQITDVNFRQVFPCIQLLVQQYANLNLRNKNGMTPIMNILKNRNLNLENKKAIIKYLLHNGNNVNLDDKIRALLNKVMPYFDIENELNSQNHKLNDDVIVYSSNDLWNFNRLFHALKNNKEDEFLSGIENVAKKSPEYMSILFTTSEQRETLLIVAVSKDLTNATQKLIELGANVNYFIPTETDSMTPLKSAVVHGHCKCLALLLNLPEIEINSAPLMPIAARNLGRKFSNDTNFEKCFQMLLKHPQIDVNQVDSTDCTALHYTVKCNNAKATMALLKKGAYFGMKNKLGQLAILDIDAKVLKKHLDTCITSNGLRPSDDNFEIEFNFKNFALAINNNNNNNNNNNQKDESITNGMSAIAYVSLSEDLRELIMHPLIMSFASLRWRRLAVLFYINFILCAFWAVNTITYILIYYNNRYTDSFSYCMIAVISLLTMYVIGREIAQFIHSPRIYVTSMDNYIECTLIVLTMLILFDMYSDNWRRTFAASTILLMAVEFFLNCGSLPFWSFSSYYLMLTTVAASFLRSLALYSIILVAFSLAFFTLLHEPIKMNESMREDQQQTNDADHDDNYFNNFPNIGLSIMKTFVMATGEFDAADINFGVNSFSMVVFVVFVLLVSIVLFNLLTGLAVSDTQLIKFKAEQTDFIRHVQVLALYDTVISKLHMVFRLFNIGSRRFDALTSIRVRPNNYNHILIVETDSANDETTEKGVKLKSLHVHLDSKIVRNARQIVDENLLDEQDVCEVEQLTKRIANMENMLKIIVDKLNDLIHKRYE